MASLAMLYVMRKQLQEELGNMRQEEMPPVKTKEEIEENIRALNKIIMKRNKYRTDKYIETDSSKFKKEII